MKIKTDWAADKLLGFGSGARTSTAKVGKDVILESPRAKS